MNGLPGNRRATPRRADKIAQWLAWLGGHFYALRRLPIHLQLAHSLKPRVNSAFGLRAVPAMAYAQIKGIPYQRHSSYTGNRAHPTDDKWTNRWTIKR